MCGHLTLVMRCSCGNPSRCWGQGVGGDEKRERERERERENNKWLHAGSEVNSRTNFHLRIPQEKCGVFLLISILAIKGLFQF